MSAVKTRLAAELTASRILSVRQQRVMVDADLAELYGVTTKAFNQAVRRNSERFPTDFAFRLTASEKLEVVTNCDHLARLKYSPQLPWAFTEHGAVMVASVLSSPRAIEMSIFVVRAFVQLREQSRADMGLGAKLDALERKVGTHDIALRNLVKAIRQLTESTPTPRKSNPIGFVTPSEKTGSSSRRK